MTQTQYDTILESLKNGSTIIAACEGAGISYSSFCGRLVRDKVMRQEVDMIRDQRAHIVEDAYYKKLVSGKAHPLEYIFYLKNRLPERWRDVKEVKGEGFNNITMINFKSIIEQANKTDSFLPNDSNNGIADKATNNRLPSDLAK